MSEDIAPISPDVWGVINKPIILEMPSGQKCRVRVLEMEDIIRLNLVNELDTFSGFFEEHDPNNPDSGMSMMKKLSDGDNFDRFSNTMDKVVVDSVVEPRILPRDANHEPGAVFVNQVPFVDKMAIFSAVFKGLGDMGDFREEQSDGVGAVEEQPIPAVPSVAPSQPEGVS